MRRLTDLLVRFRRDEQGVFAVFFAILAIVLIATAGAVVDFTSIETNRGRAQTALDSAALALQTRIGIDNATTLQSKAQLLLTQQINNASITATVTGVTVDSTAGKIDLTASVTAPTAFVRLVGINSLSANLLSEATRGSKDIEVAVSLDTTGSMLGTKISDLKKAMNGDPTASPPTVGLINLIVQDTQTPTYSKMSIIPWSQAVNVGSTYADSVRGALVAGTAITNATWMSTITVSINAITKANPAVITTSASHGLSTGSYVWISGIHGMTQIDDGIYKVTLVNSTKVSLQYTNGTNVDSRLYSTYSTSTKGKITGCLNTSCQVVVTSAGHGLSTGDNVHILSVGGMTGINNSSSTVHPVGATTASTFVLGDEDASTIGYTAYTSGGSAYCVLYGCNYYYFQNASSSHSWMLYQPNHCATERSGTHAFDDTAPSTTPLGINYVSGGTECQTQVIQPLTTDKTTLHNLVTSLSAANSTAGHLGLAWGWYMVSPNFASLWPTASQPAAYGRANLIKAVVLMTDGEFNMQYCNGVLSKDSDEGSSTSEINCNAPDGESHDQAVTLCTNIKADDIVLYTVGFDLGSDTASLNFLQSCATSTADFFRADTGADLTAAFSAIAQNLNQLRLSK